jgi:hypothetical protein
MFHDQYFISRMELIFIEGITNGDLYHLPILKKILWAYFDCSELLWLDESFLLFPEGIDRTDSLVLFLHILDFFFSCLPTIHEIQLFNLCQFLWWKTKLCIIN